MNSFRISIIALSLALVFSAGSSATATTNYSHPQFTVTEDRTLSLRKTGSRLVVDTIENALRQGGLALFDERFQIDSSLDWVLGEDVSGELDAVIPLWSKGRHNVFTQPGFVLWKGLADDDRLDGNLGVVYRTETIKGIIGGASLFYDHDFQIGHSRLGIGVDAQRDGFYGAFNYYHPLSDTQDARERYVEDALQGMDASVAVESDVTRVGGNVGYWLFQGDENVEDEWEFSYGFDAGLRLMPGVFLEGRLERHDKEASFGRRASVGLAFRFTLPNLDGKSYGDGGRVSNLYRPVDREKRVLYEEREAITGPSVSIVRIGDEAGQVTEGETIELDILLSEALEEDVTINLVGSGEADYGADGDWLLDNGSGNDCDSVVEGDCQVTISAGQTNVNGVEITVRDDGDTGEGVEDIILSMVVVSAGGTGLMSGDSLVLNIEADPPLPTVSLNYSESGRTLAINEDIAVTLTLSEALDTAVTVNLVPSGTSNYGLTGDWNLHTAVPSVTGIIRLCGDPCEITFMAGQTSADVHFAANANVGATAGVYIEIPSAAQTSVRVGSLSRLDFTIGEAPPTPLPTVSLNYEGSTTIAATSSTRMRIDLSEVFHQNEVKVTLVGSGATYANAGNRTWNLQYIAVSAGMMPDDAFPLSSAASCRVNDIMNAGCEIIFPQGQTIIDVNVTAELLTSGDNINLTLGVHSESSSLVTLGSSSTLTLTAQ